MDVTVEFTSMSKTFSIFPAGDRFAVGNERIIAALARVKSYSTMVRSRPCRWRRPRALNVPRIASAKCAIPTSGGAMASFGRAG